MANIELVIKIPEDEYQNILLTGKASFCAVNAIEAGTPLPKGHGRLIDADEFEELFGKKCVGDCGACMTKRKTDGRGRWYDTCPLIDIPLTIIEADTESEEDKE